MSGGRWKVAELRAMEVKIQAKWEEEHLFETCAPDDKTEPKFMCTFPYPYMNGRLHLGHTFTLSKCEFAVGYHRLHGVRCLFPLGLHCTGMPIKACADKLAREMQLYGTPPVFPLEEEEVIVEAPTELVMKEAKAKGKKSKAVAKSAGCKYQWQIMRTLGLTDEEIAEFGDPLHWLSYFPPRCIADLKRLGVKIDWRRSFITTDANPLYDSFVAWQFECLRRNKHIDFGKRMSIYSPLDRQPCMDHDRSSGEGVAPQQYTIIKMKCVLPLVPALQALSTDDRPIYFVAATLRPETMYGQTNFFLHPDIKYIAFVALEGEKECVFIATRRSARNMSYQMMLPKEGEVEILGEVAGALLMGQGVHAPLTPHPTIYALPMLTVKEDKGTGVVTSVPSDSPDDYVALTELKNKPALRQKYNIQDSMVMPFTPIPIMSIPELGDMAAVTVVEEMKITSQNDAQSLAVAKEKVYLKGFYEGVLLVGEHKGSKVQQVKLAIRQQLMDEGTALSYEEPERRVISRSGDECVVAACDQWYLDYSLPEWKAATHRALKQCETYCEESNNNLERTIDWLHEHACSRSYGLGSRVPWDKDWLIESLSDSTIYMAYYTVAHLLQPDTLDASKVGPLGITAADMTPAVWDYVFRRSDNYKSTTGLSREKADILRTEFTYWYPVDLRVSGKDLLQNHLSYYLFNHVSMWPEQENLWPKSIRANGHLLLNGEKMAKQTGNFLTLYDGVDKYSADGMRLALADSGDGVDDANFMENMADAGVLRLFNLIEWATSVTAAVKEQKLREGKPRTFADRVFDNEMNYLMEITDGHYKLMMYRDVVKTGCYEYQVCRDRYREMCGGEEEMDAELVLRFITTQALLLSPICPHVCEHLWTLLGHSSSILHARWPTVTRAVDHVLREEAVFVDDAVREFRLRMKGKNAAEGTHGTIFVARRYPGWQATVLTELQRLEEGDTLPDNKTIAKHMAQTSSLKSNIKKVMPFVADVRLRFETAGRSALDIEAHIDERALLQDNIAYIRSSLDLEEVRVEDATTDSQHALLVCPGKPIIHVYTPPSAHITLINPQKNSAHFTISLPIIAPSDSVKQLVQRLRRSAGTHIHPDDRVCIYTYASSNSARSMPPHDDLVEMEEEELFTVHDQCITLEGGGKTIFNNTLLYNVFCSTR